MPVQSCLDPRPSPRDRILVAAHDLFYRDGIRATGIDRVITQAQVTKVTFYRQFVSKDVLISAYLAYRHERWISWLNTALTANQAQYPDSVEALVATFRQWWTDPLFRGCAFINAAVELGPPSPDTLEVFRRHKADMQATLSQLLPESDHESSTKAQALALAIDGAIIHAQAGVPLESVCAGLRLLIRHL